MTANKSSMVKAPRIIAGVDADGNIVPMTAEPGKPQPFVYADENGELKQGVRIIKEVKSGNREYWWKLMLTDLLDLLEDMSGKQTQALRAILDQFDPHNGIVLVTQRQLAEQAGCSLSTVSKVLHLMIKHDLIQMPQRGVYTINPDFMSQGGAARYNAMLVQYRDASIKTRTGDGDGNEEPQNRIGSADD